MHLPSQKAKSVRKALRFLLIDYLVTLASFVALPAALFLAPQQIYLLIGIFILLPLSYFGLVFVTAIIADALWENGPLIWLSVLFGLIFLVAPVVAFLASRRLRES